MELNKKTLSISKRKLFGLVLLSLLLISSAVEASIIFSGMQANSLLPYMNPSTSAFIERYQSESQTKVTLRWKSLPQISNALKRAVLVSEDDAFFEHDGVDFKELKNGWEINWKKKRIVRGGSTLSMQLVKNLYLSPSKNPIRKVNEILLTMDLERKVSKP